MAKYRTPYGPSIPCLSTRLRMKATIPPPPVAVNGCSLSSRTSRHKARTASQIHADRQRQRSQP